MSNKPIWLTEAEKYIGLKEIAGPKNNATVRSEEHTSELQSH